MEKKLKELALKTGMSEGEVSGFARAGMLGAMAAAVLGLFGCARTNGSVQTQAAQEPARPAISAETQETVDRAPVEVKKSTPPVINPDDSCGPFPGYPCGSRYFTVSVADFRKAA
ncbi:MAG: hypothetical protein FD189_637 [Elusimicrobia bacterium]|nr:MAG: hypothetical protein FD154_635 [Elusimicrobiota bacterium]KAF0157369.1 MAG: hypothetical protein FD189_637 [Elusimicrobiota bacterium]